MHTFSTRDGDSRWLLWPRPQASSTLQMAVVANTVGHWRALIGCYLQLTELMRVIHGDNLGIPKKKAAGMNSAEREKAAHKKMKAMHKKVLKMTEGKKIDRNCFVDYVLYNMQVQRHFVLVKSNSSCSHILFWEKLVFVFSCLRSFSFCRGKPWWRNICLRICCAYRFTIWIGKKQALK